VQEARHQLLVPAVIEKPPYSEITDEFVKKLEDSIILVCGEAHQGDEPNPPLLGIVTAFDIL
jgi:hypothetical protein